MIIHKIALDKPLHLYSSNLFPQKLIMYFKIIYTQIKFLLTVLQEKNKNLKYFFRGNLEFVNWQRFLAVIKRVVNEDSHVHNLA